MMIKNCLVVLLLLSMCFTGVSHGDEFTSEKRKDIEELFSLSIKNQLLDQTATTLSGQIFREIKKKNPNIPEKESLKIIRNEIVSGVTEMMLDLYNKYFTHQEIKDTLAFMRTSTGIKYNSVLPAMLREMPTVAQQKLTVISLKSYAALNNAGLLASSGNAKQTSQQNNSAKSKDNPKETTYRQSFYSEDFGNFNINTWLYFDKETDRIYKSSFSNEIRGSAFSYFLFCAARKYAKDNGYDFWTTGISENDTQSAEVGFFKKGENAETILGTRFAKEKPTDVDEPNIASMCAKGTEQVRKRK